MNESYQSADVLRTALQAVICSSGPLLALSFLSWFFGMHLGLATTLLISIGMAYRTALV
jgi:hypothetical protein